MHRRSSAHTLSLADDDGLVVNDDTPLEVTDDTLVLIDGEEAESDELEPGMTVEYELGDDTSPDSSDGSALRVPGPYRHHAEQVGV